jgi:5-methylcytosine-specific restriction endonuclease McrA
MSVSGRRRFSGIVKPARTKPGKVVKIRRTREQAYGPNWDAMCLYVKNRDGWRCRDCGVKTRHLEVHHIIPVSKGGLTIAFNLKSVCHKCHDSKPGHQHLEKRRRK